ncbi:MAG: A/G-specific adenine glycosylase [Pseudomonadota bacterium]
MDATITISQAQAVGAGLLPWYDRHHRSLPWRVSPSERASGRRPDPYRVWLSEVMLQQTTVATVSERYRAFLARWPTVEALAAAPTEDVLGAWAGLGYYARARNLHKCARVVAEEYAGRFPDTEEGLRALPGVGAYTAAAVAAIAFERPAAVLDANIERVLARLFAVTEPLPGVREHLRALAGTLTPEHRPGDHAQALMDLGATICTARNPTCLLCPISEGCAGLAEGIAPTLPRKPARRAKPVRHGTAWVALDDTGHVLVVRRPDKGLLGGMLGLPSSDWAEVQPTAKPPMAAHWARLGEVRHTFTHFQLHLEVQGARLATLSGKTQPLAKAEAVMPTVFAKALKLARQGLA